MSNVSSHDSFRDAVILEVQDRLSQIPGQTQENLLRNWETLRRALRSGYDPSIEVGKLTLRLQTQDMHHHVHLMVVGRSDDSTLWNGIEYAKEASEALDGILRGNPIPPEYEHSLRALVGRIHPGSVRKYQRTGSEFFGPTQIFLQGLPDGIFHWEYKSGQFSIVANAKCIVIQRMRNEA